MVEIVPVCGAVAYRVVTFDKGSHPLTPGPKEPCLIGGDSSFGTFYLAIALNIPSVGLSEPPLIPGT